MKLTDEPLPCPFCGNIPFVAEEMDPYDWWYVCCRAPGCILPIAGGHTSAESAIAKWNRRAAPVAADAAASTLTPHGPDVERMLDADAATPSETAGEFAARHLAAMNWSRDPAATSDERRPAKFHCQNGGDVCLAGNCDGVCCPEDSCDIDDGTRKNPLTEAQPDERAAFYRKALHQIAYWPEFFPPSGQSKIQKFALSVLDGEPALSAILRGAHLVLKSDLHLSGIQLVDCVVETNGHAVIIGPGCDPSGCRFIGNPPAPVTARATAPQAAVPLTISAARDEGNPTPIDRDRNKQPK